MKVCLLVCDHVPKELAQVHGTYPEMFGKLLPELSLHPYFVCDGSLPDVSEFDAYICTGSRFSVYDTKDWIHALKSFFADVCHWGRKLAGVCFGHQMIAYTFGGSVERASAGWSIGVHRFNLIRSEPWMNPPAGDFKLYMLCRDQVVRLPPSAEALAENKVCLYAAFRLGNNFLGIQGHPEFSKAYLRAVYDSRAALIGEEKIRAADRTMTTGPDRQLIARWIVNFLKG